MLSVSSNFKPYIIRLLDYKYNFIIRSTTSVSFLKQVLEKRAFVCVTLCNCKLCVLQLRVRSRTLNGLHYYCFSLVSGSWLDTIQQQRRENDEQERSTCVTCVEMFVLQGESLLRETLSWWTPTRRITTYHSWFAILFSRNERNVSRPLYHGIFILICPNMLSAMSVDSAYVRILWKLRQQRGLKMVLAYVTNVLVKMKMFRTRCMLFYFAKTIGFMSSGNTFPFYLHLFWRTFQQPN